MREIGLLEDKYGFDTKRDTIANNLPKPLLQGGRNDAVTMEFPYLRTSPNDYIHALLVFDNAFCGQSYKDR